MRDDAGLVGKRHGHGPVRRAIPRGKRSRSGLPNSTASRRAPRRNGGIRPQRPLAGSDRRAETEGIVGCRGASPRSGSLQLLTLQDCACLAAGLHACPQRSFLGGASWRANGQTAADRRQPVDRHLSVSAGRRRCTAAAAEHQPEQAAPEDRCDHDADDKAPERSRRSSHCAHRNPSTTPPHRPSAAQVNEAWLRKACHHARRLRRVDAAG